MQRWFRSSAAFVLGGIMLIGSGGCDSEQQPAESRQPGVATQASKPSKPTPAQKAQTEKTTGRAHDARHEDRHE